MENKSDNLRKPRILISQMMTGREEIIHFTTRFFTTKTAAVINQNQMLRILIED